MVMRRIRGFTLIELLIVVAIIGILVGIAGVNYLNAQIRARLARVKSDFRNIETAIESYRIDYTEYPPTSGQPRLTSPIAYLSSWPKSPFVEPGNYRQRGKYKDQYDVPTWLPARRIENLDGWAPTYLLTTSQSSEYEGADAYNPPINTVDTDGDGRMDDIQKDFVYMVGKIGDEVRYESWEKVPANIHWNLKSVGPNEKDDRAYMEANPEPGNTIYDPTNGLRSEGDLIRFGPGWGGYGTGD